MPQISLGSRTDEAYATVDAKDLEELSGHRWWLHHSHGRLYAATRIGGKLVLMHVFLAKRKAGEEVDHKNGDGLDNRRSNLRVCTKFQNAQNRGTASHNTSGYKGVYFDPTSKKWRVQIRASGKKHNLGSFSDLTHAAHEYNKAAIRLHGEFACLNPI